MKGKRVRIEVALLCAALPLASAVAGAAAETHTAVAGPRYGVNRLHRLFFGSDYRELWTAPVELEVLDLGSYAGGLTPRFRVGGQQTRGLALQGADGKSYTFRGVDKDPSEVLSEDLRRTFVRDLVQDQIASAHPSGAVVAAGLLEAAGVLHTDPRLVVMPDDPRLGEFHKEFAGLVGTIELYPTPGFAGSTEILDAEELYRRIQASASERPDARAYLRARLMDLFLGDWDRHRKQWRWARIPGQPSWQPIPEDRDQAFVRFEGFMLMLARQANPQLVRFSDRYPRMEGLTWNGREQDRRFLTGLGKEAYAEIAADLQHRLTDAAIDAAVARMPAAWRELDGARLARLLKVRRDLLAVAARKFYRHLAEEVDIHLSDEDEVVEIDRRPGGEMIVRARRAADTEWYYARTFDRRETHDVRVYLHGGDDRVTTHGGSGPGRLRVIGGPGDDVVDDSQGGGTRFYDAEGHNELKGGPGSQLDERPYTTPPPDPDSPWIPPRDWGQRYMLAPWLSAGTDLGLFFGLDWSRRSYGFREDPYASLNRLASGYSTGRGTGRVRYDGRFHRLNSRMYADLSVLASGVETLNFYGFGNQTRADAEDDRFFSIVQQQVVVAPSLSLPLGRGRLSLGPRFKLTATDLDKDRLITRLQPYGTEDTSQLGAEASFALDTRAEPNTLESGLRLNLRGALYPEALDLQDTFGQLGYEGAAYWQMLKGVQLAGRIGGMKVWGTAPYYDAAFLGGADSLRGYRKDRFAGDASLYGSAELRLYVTSFFFILPGDLGIFGHVDSGRVWAPGETSDAWHTAWGGGVWLSFIDRANTFSVSVSKSDEKTTVYLKAGFSF